MGGPAAELDAAVVGMVDAAVLRSSGLHGKPRGRSAKPVKGSERSSGHRRWWIVAAQRLTGVEVAAALRSE